LSKRNRFAKLAYLGPVSGVSLRDYQLRLPVLVATVPTRSNTRATSNVRKAQKTRRDRANQYAEKIYKVGLKSVKITVLLKLRRAGKIRKAPTSRGFA
jgi:hypothetical protein